MSNLPKISMKMKVAINVGSGAVGMWPAHLARDSRAGRRVPLRQSVPLPKPGHADSLRASRPTGLQAQSRKLNMAGEIRVISRQSYPPPKQRVAGLCASTSYPDVNFSSSQNFDIGSDTLAGAGSDRTACVADRDTEIVDECQIESNGRGGWISKSHLELSCE